jgi:hypothetical protein
MNKRQQKHEMLVTFMAHLKPAKRQRPAPVQPTKLRLLMKLFVPVLVK